MSVNSLFLACSTEKSTTKSTQARLLRFGDSQTAVRLIAVTRLSLNTFMVLANRGYRVHRTLRTTAKAGLLTMISINRDISEGPRRLHISLSSHLKPEAVEFVTCQQRSNVMTAN